MFTLHDITETQEKENILTFTNNRAHRNEKKKFYKEIIETCYWPTLKQVAEKLVKNI